MASLVDGDNLNLTISGFSLVPDESQYIVYHVEVSPPETTKSFTVYRRYKDFEELAKELGADWKAKMPPKTFFKSRSMEFMTERQAALSVWLHEVVAEESLRASLPVRKFLGEQANQMPRGAKPVTSKSAQGQDPYKEDKTGGVRGKVVFSGWLKKLTSMSSLVKGHERFLIISDKAIEWWKGKERKDHGYDLGDMVRQTSDYAGFLEAEKYERIAVVPFEEVVGVSCSARSFEFDTGKLTLYVWQAQHESEALEVARFIADRLKNPKIRKAIYSHDEDADDQYKSFFRKSGNSGMLTREASISCAEELNDGVATPNARQIWAGCGCGDFVDFGTFKKFVHGIEGSEIAAALGPFKEVPEDFAATIGAKSMSAKCDMGDVFEDKAADDDRTFSTDETLRANLKRVESMEEENRKRSGSGSKADTFKAAAAEKAAQLKQGAARSAERFREGAAIAATNFKNGSARLVKQVSDMAHNLTASPENSEDEAEEEEGGKATSGEAAKDGEGEGETEAGATEGGAVAAEDTEGGAKASEGTTDGEATASEAGEPAAAAEPTAAAEDTAAAATADATDAAPATTAAAADAPKPALASMVSDSCLIDPNAPIEG